MIVSGLRFEPASLKAYPGLHHFELVKPTWTQVFRNVWDTAKARTGDGANNNGGRNLAFWAELISNCRIGEPWYRPCIQL